MNDDVQSELEALCSRADEFYARGDAFGASGNLSVRRGDRVWITPTGSSLRGLDPDSLACLDLEGGVVGGEPPSKEYPFHLAIYRTRPETGAVVHLHAPHCTAVSCLADLDASEPLPALTPYYIMRVSPLGLVDYYRPGSAALADDVARVSRHCANMLMRNHGMICTGSTMKEAAERAIELEEACRLVLLLRGLPVRRLDDAEIRELLAALRPASDGR